MLMKLLDRAEETIIAFLMGAATLVIFFAVLHRYLAGVPYVQDWALKLDLSWAQELCIIMFVWMAKFGAAYGVRTGVHVGVDVAINQLEPPSRYWVVLFGLAAGAFFTFTIGSFGLRFVLHMYETGQQSNDLEAPMWIVYLAIPVGSYLMCFRFVQVALAFQRTGALPHTDESHVEGVEPIPESVLVEAGVVKPAVANAGGGAR